MTVLLDRLAPRPLGPAFRWLWGSNLVANVGDGSLLGAAQTIVWGTTSTTVRQRAVPSSLLGRVTSVYMLAMLGGLVIGAPIGGLLAQQLGITAPFWFGFSGSGILLGLIWRTLDDIAHAPSAEPDDGTEPGAVATGT